MPRLTPQHWKTLVRAFASLGFEWVRTKGSHIVMSKPGVARPLVIPKESSVRVAVIESNLRTAGVSARDFLEVLARI